MDNPARYVAYLGQPVRVVVDRPLGTRHPRMGFVYEVNYGYLPETTAGDGAEIDAYVLGRVCTGNRTRKIRMSRRLRSSGFRRCRRHPQTVAAAAFRCR